jgi:hypothetical protein
VKTLSLRKKALAVKTNHHKGTKVTKARTGADRLSQGSHQAQHRGHNRVEEIPMEIVHALEWLVTRFFIYCFMPLFAFLLVVTIGLRDFSSVFNFPEFAKNIVRRFF